ncbi:hypothetical protein P175DRAFT_0147074 [Aspergillus ochraceoroseus IBT 24754]|uniref:Uncharacterized protein n=1 Tax=Aspergillus ochraceoroseus IBT 24754 TaxID=1392256 RepID=A0A2T5M2S9_9EURO|nr:uncharacterized protein P175DRAFT_0147074 [Aspergillus ochraceoroseus IBT 24754]PTU22819.1 hypothetical protein P175DRAFT_0147074 [Aspergillus ochraceoroseus IBT 24754]
MHDYFGLKRKQPLPEHKPLVKEDRRRKIACNVFYRKKKKKKKEAEEKKRGKGKKKKKNTRKGKMKSDQRANAVKRRPGSCLVECDGAHLKT